MATLCKEVDEKIRVDLGNEEIQDITNAIDILIRRFAGSLCDFNKDIKFNKKFSENKQMKYHTQTQLRLKTITGPEQKEKVDRLELCGSMAEGTRIWEPKVNLEYDLEFDYIAVMKEWPGYGKLSFIPSDKEGKMKMKCEIIARESVSGYYTFLSTEIKWAFKNLVLKGIREQCERNLCTRQLSGLVNVPGCPYCTIYKKTGSLRWYNKSESNRNDFLRKSVLYCVWSSRNTLVSNPLRTTRLENRSPNPYLKDTLQVKIDFHPVIEVNKEMIERKKDGTTIPLEDDMTYFLFPRDIGSFDWRISVYHEELKMFKDASEEHKLAFCVLKFIGNAFGHMRLANPYEIKCIALNHIKRCQTSNRRAHECLLDMIRDFYECSQFRKLPHPVLAASDFYCMDSIFHEYEGSLRPQIKHLRKTLFSLFDQQGDISLKDLYCDKETLFSLHTQYESTKNETLFADFLKNRRQAPAEVVLEDEKGFPFCNTPGGWWTL